MWRSAAEEPRNFQIDGDGGRNEVARRGCRRAVELAGSQGLRYTLKPGASYQEPVRRPENSDPSARNPAAAADAQGLLASVDIGRKMLQARRIIEGCTRKYCI